MRSSPPWGSTRGLPIREATPNHHYTSDDDGVSTDTSILDRPPHRRRGSRGSQSNWSGSDSNETHSSGGRQKKKDGFSRKIQIPEFVGKKGHPHDVADAFRQWAHCITYYRDYYEDSYLMPLVVREEIQHVLDSEIARHGQLTPHQMYEAVKKYETYVAHSKHLKGKSASPHSGQQRAVVQTSGYRPHFHKTMAFTASVEETSDPALSEPGPSLSEDEDPLGGESTQEGDEGLFILSFLEEALGGDGSLQIKMACTMQAQEKHDRKCFICQSPNHLMRDHYQGKNGKGPLQLKGPPQKQVSS